MANKKAAIKDAGQALKRRAHNSQVKSSLKSFTRSLREAVEARDFNKARDIFKTCQKIFQKAAGNKVIYKRHASRHLSRLALLINRTEKGAVEAK